MSGGGHRIIFMIGLGLNSKTHLCLLRCAGSLALHYGEVSRRILVSPIVAYKVEAVVSILAEAVFLIVFIVFQKVKVTLVFFSKATIVNVLNLSMDVLRLLQHLLHVEARR